MSTRAEIEELSRCEWFDRPCPACGKPMKAYDAVASSYDYALLCQTPDCRNWRRVAFLDDQMSSFTAENFEELTNA